MIKLSRNIPMPQTASKKVLVLGASGYIGSRLIPFLLSREYEVHALGRSLDSLKRRPWSDHPRVKLFVSDMTDMDSIVRAAEGCRAVYYLIHSMNPQNKDFARSDRRIANNAVAALSRAGVERIIYLGGLGDSKENLSKHLQSRTEVSEILHSGKIPVTTLRAAMIMGTASVSFEILSYLVHRLPMMITPRWVRVKSQPIAIRNVLNYLAGCLEKEETRGKTYDIGGPEIISYQELMDVYAEEAGLLKRFIIPVPFLTPRLSSYWIALVTPIPAVLAMPLAEGLRNEVICLEEGIKKIIPQELMNCRQAIRLSLNKDRLGPIVVSGSSDIFLAPESKYPGDPRWAGAGGRYTY